MGISNKFRASSEKTIEGVWVDLGDGLKVRVAHMKNPRYQEALERLLKPHRVAMKTNTLPDDVVEAAVVEAMAEAILLDWQGDEVAYSKAAAVSYLGNPETREFRDVIAALAKDFELFRAEYEAAAEKNLPTA